MSPGLDRPRPGNTVMATGSEISEVFCAADENNALAGGLPVDARSRGRCVGQPVQRDVVEHVVSVEQARGLAVVVVEDPGREPDRRVRQGVADRLRPRAHDGAVGPVLLEERVERVERRAFLLGESRRRGPAAGEHHGHVGRDRRRQVDVDAEQSRPAPGAPSRWRRASPSRRPGRRSGCSRGASSAPPRRGRCDRDSSPCPSACRRSRSRASTGSRDGRRPMRFRRAPWDW